MAQFCNGYDGAVTMASKKKGQPTSLNISVLNDYIFGKERDQAPGGVIGLVHPTDTSHLRRLIDAKWLVPFPGERGRWVVSQVGLEGLADWREANGMIRIPGP
jgi:hypothetical protein